MIGRPPKYEFKLERIDGVELTAVELDDITTILARWIYERRRRSAVSTVIKSNEQNQENVATAKNNHILSR